MRRLFISINIPEDIKSRIRKKNDILESALPDAKYAGEKNWHLTLIFLGYQEDGAVLPIINSMKETADRFASPEIILDKISYAPPAGPPRMIWLYGNSETSKNLSFLKIALEDELIKNKVRFKLENREFNSHTTLARLNDIPKEELPEIGKEFEGLDLFFVAGGLDLMESRLSKSGPTYELLQHIDFEGD